MRMGICGGAFHLCCTSPTTAPVPSSMKSLLCSRTAGALKRQVVTIVYCSVSAALRNEQATTPLYSAAVSAR